MTTPSTMWPRTEEAVEPEAIEDSAEHLGEEVVECDPHTIRFFPDHVISEATALILLLCVYSLLAIFLPAHLDIKADPAVPPALAKPEWYFLFVYSFLRYVTPVVGTTALVVGFVLLTALPWLDRNPARKPRKRIVAIAAGLLVTCAVIALSVLGALR